MEIKDRILSTIIEGDSQILHTNCELVQHDEFKQLPEIKEKMLEMMLKAGGIGLAAPQVGLLKRILIIKRSNGEILFMVNPEVVKLSQMKTQSTEGCLSVPNKTVKKIRSRQSTVMYKDELGVTREIRLGGLDSFVFQHELDHLNGILMDD